MCVRTLLFPEALFFVPRSPRYVHFSKGSMPWHGGGSSSWNNWSHRGHGATLQQPTGAQIAAMRHADAIWAEQRDRPIQPTVIEADNQDDPWQPNDPWQAHTTRPTEAIVPMVMGPLVKSLPRAGMRPRVHVPTVAPPPAPRVQVPTCPAPPSKAHGANQTDMYFPMSTADVHARVAGNDAASNALHLEPPGLRGCQTPVWPSPTASASADAFTRAASAVAERPKPPCPVWQEPPLPKPPLPVMPCSSTDICPPQSKSGPNSLHGSWGPCMVPTGGPPRRKQPAPSPPVAMGGALEHDATAERA